jgi:hypothetical protein
MKCPFGFCSLAVRSLLSQALFKSSSACRSSSQESWAKSKGLGHKSIEQRSEEIETQSSAGILGIRFTSLPISWFRNAEISMPMPMMLASKRGSGRVKSSQGNEVGIDEICTTGGTTTKKRPDVFTADRLCMSSLTRIHSCPCMSSLTRIHSCPCMSSLTRIHSCPCSSNRRERIAGFSDQIGLPICYQHN